MGKRIGRLHVITDTVVQTRYGHVELAAFAVAGGADSIQLRDKRLSDEELIAVAREIVPICRRAGVPLIINDRIAVAAAVGADGVHLGRDDAPIAAARQVLGPDAIVGGSAGSIEDAVEAESMGADYVGFGHIFPTASKEKTGPPAGIGLLRKVCDAVVIPVVAVGGINRHNAASVVEAGAWGVAVIGAVCGASDPARAARAVADAIATDT